ncbi:hypothetical protein [Raineyella fluvialis]|uniref:Uncharacterized protein n=1 Tax=Raineyella fluvialis TaxID=2662261 RepID=A0A5Q2FAI3_9ACTN|nr:hypothetical protein [Raineyella fluvialis]QGF23381.1 hypothetical protein Rai3103_06570 [Raineyella fluvialis]
MTSPTFSGPTAYETWVHTLRAWSSDPTISLSHLPPLQDDTYTPQTYERLMVYITEALEAVSARWVDQLGRALSTWGSPFDLAHELIQLRAGLARRVQLSSHPSLPPGIRTVLLADSRRTVERYQRELEEGVREGLSRGRLPRADQEHVLRVVAENSFVRVLDMAVSQDGSRQTVAPLPVVQSDGPPVSRFGHRRLPPSV